MKKELPFTELWRVVEHAVAEIFVAPISDEECLALFHLLHNYEIECEDGWYYPETQRGVAQQVASIWWGVDADRADPGCWYFAWLERPRPTSELVETVRLKLLEHPLIYTVVYCDD